MDVALALWQINPAAESLLSDDKRQIIEWRGPSEQPTQEQLETAWTTYQAARTAQEQAKEATEQQRLAYAQTLHEALMSLGKPAAAAAVLGFLGVPTP